MPLLSFCLILLANICVNLLLVGLLYHWQRSRRQSAHHALRFQVKHLCQQVGKLEMMWEKRDDEEMLL